MAATVAYRKMNGLGNDFVVLDARAHKVALSGDQVRWIADREQGIGCDQLIVVTAPSANGIDAGMRTYNADGGEVAACGNATRCIAAMLTEETGRPDTVIETAAGILRAHRAGEVVTVDMGPPRFRWDEIPLAEPFEDTRGIELQIGPIDAPVLHTPSALNVGNPHAIFWVSDPSAYDLSRLGPLLENHPIFPERANISLARIDSREHLTVVTWERGAGLTRACGTAACAAAVAAARKGLAGRKVTVSLPGGDLKIEWRESDGHILMTGPFSFDGEGTLPAELFAESAA
ncbi:MAG: diaminopimelate epimerase [Cucumibacter sp.]